MEGCGSGLTRTRMNSVSSAITADSSKDSFVHHNANATLGPSTKWTDEKHSLYIDSLEASFVDQLHRSMGLCHWHSQENVWGPYLSRKLPAITHNSSDQFMVLRDGCWQKINFERNEPLFDSTADSHVILESPWIRHFRYAGTRGTVTSHDLQKQSMLGSKRDHLRGNSTFSSEIAGISEHHPVRHPCHQDLVGCVKEVSDQNFADENQGEKLYCASMAKRLKATAAYASSKDQIVPSGRFQSANVSTAGNGPSERGA